MAQFDVYAGSSGYLLDVQSDLIDSFSTRLVVPLVEEGIAIPHPRFNPLLQIGDRTYVMATQYLGAIPRNELREQVANVRNDYDRIIAAVDMIVRGF
jgi:toxin CcdB